ncbi:MAG: response regulator [Paenibacillus sp.]|nr:response regulator [Paenibacillus sp.]
MHEVLIVDDESIARASLTYLIDWETYGFAITAEASNGQQALNLIRERYFSLVVTDVRMPVMDGLAFIAELRAFSDVPVIILSGYEDFEYARQGIKMGVQDYLLKPVDEDDLIEVLKRIEGQLAQRYLKGRQLDRGLSVLQEQFLRKWTSGGMKPGKEFEEQAKLVGWTAPEGRYGCLIVELDRVPMDDNAWSPEGHELRKFSVRNIITEIAGPDSYAFELTEDRLGLLCALSGVSGGESSWLELASKLSEAVADYGKQTVSIGVGSIADAADQVPASLAAAEKALDGKFLTGKASILTAHTFESSIADLASMRVLGAELLDVIRTYRTSQIPRVLQRIWDGLREGNVPQAKAKPFVLELLLQLFRTLKEAGADEDSVFDHEYGDYDFVMKSKSMEELQVFMERKCAEAAALLLRLKEVQPNQSIEEIKAWVAEHYGSNISLRTIAGQMYMNPAYLGQLFKSHVDMTFNDYLLKVRMDKAIELLLRTDKKVYEIAGEVGYKQLDWFYKRFKAYTGISAGEYRASIQQ